MAMYKINKWIWISFSILTFLILLKNWKFIFISMFIFGLIVFIIYITKPTFIKQKIDANYKIIDKNFMGVVIKKNKQRILIHTKEAFNVSDIIHVIGKTSKIPVKYSTFLLTHKISNIIEKPNITLISKSLDFRNQLVDFLSNPKEYYSPYSLLILLGIKTQDNREIYNLAIKINVVHLFVISGFHISLFFIIITSILNKLKTNTKVSGFLGLVVVLFYLYTLRFPLSATRAFFLTLLSYINKHFLKQKFSNITILTFTLLIMIVINPFSITSFSFVLTFTATFAIFIFNEIEFKSKFKKSISFILLIYLSTMPVIIAINGFVSIFGIVYSSVLAPFFVVVYTITLFCFPFKDLMIFIYKAFDWILHFINNINPIVEVNFINLKIAQTIYLISYLFLIIYIWLNYFMEKKTI